MTAAVIDALARLAVRNWKAPITFGIFALIAVVLFIVLGHGGETTFRLSGGSDLIQLPPLVVPVAATTLAIAVALIALTGLATWMVPTGRRVRPWMGVAFGVLFLVAFLTWAAAGQTLPVLGLLIGTVGISVPIIFGALGGVISERAGVINVAIEGQLLGGAFTSALVASVTGSPFLGLIGAVIAGVLVSLILAVFAIRYWVDQVIVGVVLNVFVTGLTSFLYSTVLSKNAEALNSPPRFPVVEIPILSQIPILGPALFRQTVIVYAAYVAVAAVYVCLFHTKWGLRLRAVGEHPQAADTVGIRVNATRFWSVSIAGAVAGVGGAYFTLGAVGSFQQDMTAGLGYIALAAVIFGRWDPIRATLAALLFGFATNLQYVLSVIGSPVPSEFMLMLPYVVTIVAVAGLVGRVRGPAAAGLLVCEQMMMETAEVEETGMETRLFGTPGGRWAGPVAVLGSVNLDLVSRQERLPVPGETIFGHELQRVPGGKGLNQAVAAARAGAEVAFLGRVGSDAEGVLLTEVLADEGVHLDRLITDPQRSTGIALVSVLDGGENAIVVIAGANDSEAWDIEDELIVAKASALVAQLERPVALVGRALESARRHGVTTVLTPAPVSVQAGQLLPLVDVLLLNEHEAMSLARLSDPVAAAGRLSDICELVVMTRGAGATCVARGGAIVMRIPSRPTAVVDTTGAGDCFAGTLIARLAAGDALPDALRWASIAASLSVERTGASRSMPLWSEVRHAATAAAEQQRAAKDE